MFVRRRTCRLAPPRRRAFSPGPQRELQLPEHLRLGMPEIHDPLALPSVRPSPSPATMASADSSLRLRRDPFRSKARSPRVRTVTFPAHRRIYTLAVGRKSFAVVRPLALASSASYPLPVRRCAGLATASFSAGLAAAGKCPSPCGSLWFLQPSSIRTFTFPSQPMPGTRTSRASRDRLTGAFGRLLDARNWRRRAGQPATLHRAQ